MIGETIGEVANVLEESDPMQPIILQVGRNERQHQSNRGLVLVYFLKKPHLLMVRFSPNDTKASINLLVQLFVNDTVLEK